MKVSKKNGSKKRKLARSSGARVKKASGRGTDPKRVSEILAKLNQAYPEVTCALKHENAFQLLISTILSAQCTDVRVEELLNYGERVVIIEAQRDGRYMATARRLDVAILVGDATVLDLTRHEDPKKIEQDLMKIVPQDRWISFSHQLIWHGRLICVARNPKCAQCVLEKLCYSKDKTV